MTEYLVFPITPDLKKVKASSAEIARNKYVKDHVAISPNTELIIVPCSHGYKGLAQIAQIMTTLYKVTIAGLSQETRK
jgi:hypothetical protein